jgi:anti-sigma factor RsiW
MTTQYPITSEDLSGYLDGILEPARRSEVDAALATDPSLRAELADLRAIASVLGDMPVYTPRRSFTLGEEFRKPAPMAAPTPITAAPSRIVRLLPLVRQLSVAAALIFMVVAGALFFEINGGSDTSVTNTANQASQPSEDAASDEVLTERGESASANDAPLDDLTNSQASDGQGTTASDDDHTTWVWVAVGTGAVAVALGGVWYGMSHAGRQAGDNGTFA